MKKIGNIENRYLVFAELITAYVSQSKKCDVIKIDNENQMMDIILISICKNSTDINMHSQFTQHYQQIVNKRFVTRVKRSTSELMW